jgi:signal transduction histidine kinase
MGSLAHARQGAHGATTPREIALREGESPLDGVHRVLRSGAQTRAYRLLDDAHATASARASAAGGSRAAGALAASGYVAAILAELAAGADLEAADTRLAVETLADVTEMPLGLAAFAAFERMVSSPELLELPPASATEVQLTLLLHLDVVSGLVVWRCDGPDLRPLVAMGDELPLGRTRRLAQGALRGRTPLLLVGTSGLRAAPIRRFGTPVGVLVADTPATHASRIQAYLDTAAAALGPVLERELLLDRGMARERVLTQSLEQRLMRVGFDLHDGPVQDVLALGGELRLLGRELYPFVAESHRELAGGRFADLLARVEDLDHILREIAHTLESRSITSRPLGETLHRLVDEFGHRSDLDATLVITGDPESLTAAQRIAVFRAVQESLTNVREHSEASAVRVELRARRQAIEVEVRDDGKGFDVERTLARAAQRGRLGLVGMAERVRMLGGTFEIESRPGGPTTLRFALPRVVAG